MQRIINEAHLEDATSTVLKFPRLNMKNNWTLHRTVTKIPKKTDERHFGDVNQIVTQIPKKTD